MDLLSGYASSDSDDNGQNMHFRPSSDSVKCRIDESNFNSKKEYSGSYNNGGEYDSTLEHLVSAKQNTDPAASLVKNIVNSNIKLEQSLKQNEDFSDKGGSADFFGLSEEYDEDDKDESDQSCLNYAQTNESRNKEPSHFVSLASHVKVDCEEKSECKSVTTPNSEFWLSTQKPEKWNEPEKLWQVTSGNKKSVDTPNVNKRQHNLFPQKDLAIYCNKRRKVEQSQPTVCCPLEKTCFIVHHKINPYLNSTQSNRLPRKKIYDLSGHSNCVNQLQWCTAQYSHLLLSSSMDSKVKVWNVFSSESQCVQTLDQHNKAVKQAVWCSTGKQILTASFDKTARIFDVEKGMEISRYNHNNFVNCVNYHPVNFNLFVSGSKDLLQCWDCRSGTKPVRKFLYKDAFGQVQDICFLQNGLEFFTCNNQVSRDSSDRNIMAWDFNKAVVVSNQIYQERYTCTRLKVHPKEACFLAQTQGNYVAFFSTIKPYKMNKYKRLEGHTVLGYNIGCDISADGSLVASGSCDGHIHFYNFYAGRSINKLSVGGARDTVCMDVAWHPVLPSLLAVSTWDGGISLWQ